MNDSLAKPFAVVTGASSGIGYELAKQFAQNGFDLLITATGATIQDAARDLEALGANVETVEADLATYDGVESCMCRSRQQTNGFIKLCVSTSEQQMRCLLWCRSPTSEVESVIS